MSLEETGWTYDVYVKGPYWETRPIWDGEENLTMLSWGYNCVCALCSMCLVSASKAAATFLAQQSHSDHLVAVHDVTYKV